MDDHLMEDEDSLYDDDTPEGHYHMPIGEIAGIITYYTLLKPLMISYRINKWTVKKIIPFVQGVTS
jgi:hypothetical protein